MYLMLMLVPHNVGNSILLQMPLLSLIIDKTKMTFFWFLKPFFLEEDEIFKAILRLSPLIIFERFNNNLQNFAKSDQHRQKKSGIKLLYTHKLTKKFMFRLNMLWIHIEENQGNGSLPNMIAKMVLTFLKQLFLIRNAVLTSYLQSMDDLSQDHSR